MLVRLYWTCAAAVACLAIAAAVEARAHEGCPGPVPAGSGDQEGPDLSSGRIAFDLKAPPTSVSASNGSNAFKVPSVSGALPEPAAWVMMLLGAGGLGVILRSTPQDGLDHPLVRREDQVVDQGVDLGLPLAAVEDAVVADARLQMVAFAVGENA